MIGIIFFHKNIEQIYPQKWIQECINSVQNQSYNKDKIKFYEIDYGDTNKQLLPNSIFFSSHKQNYADAMNFIISQAFEDGCDFVFNTNLDDFYDKTRIEKQMIAFKAGYDIISSNFCYINEDNIIFRQMIMTNYGDIKDNLNNGHNIIAHPSVGISKNFWNDSKNRYDPNKVPQEDFELWKLSINNGYKFHILPDILLYYRIHTNQVSNLK